MINAFAINDSRLLRIDDEPAELSSAIWLDLLEPTGEEREMLQEGLGQSLASFLELEDIEASARFFEDEDGLHLHSFFYCEDEENYADLASVAFTIRDGRLFTLRDRELPAFRLYRMRSRSQRLLECNAYEVLLDLFETKIEQLADVIENVYADLEKLSRVILNGTQDEAFDEALNTLTEQEDTSSKVRLCLMDTQRALGFLVRKTRLPPNQLEQAREMGYINIEQNKIMKFFSVVSVMFLPATLVASTYGMNFEFMPEIHFKYGYPMAIGLMIGAALTPYIYFKRKGWL